MTDDTFPDDGPEPDRHAARSALYGALAAVFVYPDEETVADLTAADAAEGVLEAAETLGCRDEASQFLDALAGTDVADLESSYNDLFGIPGGDGSYAVVPYEAEYTVGDDVSLAQRRIATVAGLLDAFDLERSPDFAERHDHLALELELMQLLSAQRAASLAADADDRAGDLERIEATLLEHHLGDFLPSLAHDLRETTEDEVYLAAADLGEKLVTADLAAHPPSDVAVDGELTAPPGVSAR
ncbi:TorD/DmsD family molecular chaperone [Halorientalis halophila]|uniref:TorD/DmsD family molecular chaperone n=1 Tax=Halorientalis halophila TaxID=3108499 RepID=UPI00300B7726